MGANCRCHPQSAPTTWQRARNHGPCPAFRLGRCFFGATIHAKRAVPRAVRQSAIQTKGATATRLHERHADEVPQRPWMSDLADLFLLRGSWAVSELNHAPGT